MNTQWREAPRVLLNTMASSFAPKNAATFLFIVAVYFVAGQYGIRLAVVNPNVSAFWPPAGISLAVLLLLGYRFWPAIYAGTFLLDWNVTHSLPLSLGLAAGIALQGLVSAYLVKRYASGKNAFARPQDVFRFAVLSGLLATMISSSVGVSLLCHYGLASWSNFWPTWLTWWVGDASGVLMVAPFLVLLFGTPHSPLHLTELVEASALLMGLIVVCIICFGPLSVTWIKGPALAFLCIPFAIWTAFRFCQLEAAGTNLVLAGFATWGSLHGYGPFAFQKGAPILLEAFVGVVGTMTLAAAAEVAQRKSVEEELLGLQTILQEMVKRRTSELHKTVESLQSAVLERMEAQQELEESTDRFQQLAATIPDVFWLWESPAGRMLYVSPAYESLWGRSCQSLYKDPHSWLDAVHPEDYDRALEFLDFHEQSCKGDKFEATYRIVQPDGMQRWIHDRAFVIRDEEGRVSRVAGLARDVTDRKQLEDMVRAAQERDID